MCHPHESDSIRRISHLRSISANKKFSVAHKQIQHVAGFPSLYPSRGLTRWPLWCSVAHRSVAWLPRLPRILNVRLPFFTADYAHPMRARKRRMTSISCTLHASWICAPWTIRKATCAATQMQHFRLWRLVLVQIKIDMLPLSSSCARLTLAAELLTYQAHMYIHHFCNDSHSC
jgi:hypothetical protein